MILSSFVNTHLNPIETIKIYIKIKNAIKDDILGHIHDSHLKSTKSKINKVELETKDPTNLSLIKAIAAENKNNQTYVNVSHASKNLIQRVTNHGQIIVIGGSFDASHRTYNIDTHPTHWPAAYLAQIMSKPFACHLVWRLWIDQNLGFSRPAYRMRIGGDL